MDQSDGYVHGRVPGSWSEAPDPRFGKELFAARGYVAPTISRRHGGAAASVIDISAAGLT
jgi:hypothetical protein